MADFKKLADVEILENPSDTANVLIEENGVVMKAPKTAVGGTKYDLVMRVVITKNEEDGNFSATGEFISGSYDAVLQKLDAGIMPFALIVFSGVRWDNVEFKCVYDSCPIWYRDDEYGEYLFFEGSGYACGVRPDGTIILD